ncbi:hypothetical protein F0562_034203 [Nyssa sinensis]|uniref:Serine hydroxymethyltransferase-like domain-containing protein n=1 Tax=Nyssa sinensis TaxID=561372 RepID=A0A5J5AJN0_9ASTE|nr:hypothetical protein F0562_034203 [Nyssa sinensis]
MCLKGKRYNDASSSSSSSKRGSIEQQSMDSRRNAVRAWGNQSLCVADPDVFEIMEKEKMKQFKGIKLIASENFVCQAVMEALGSHLTNKYSEGLPGARYCVGNQYIDEIEMLCWDRALAAFNLDPDNWGQKKLNIKFNGSFCPSDPLHVIASRGFRHLSLLLCPPSTVRHSSTVTTKPSHNRTPTPPHRHAPPLLRRTRSQTRPHHLPQTRPSPHRGHLLRSTRPTRSQNPRPRLRQPPPTPRRPVPLLWLLRRHLLSLRPLLAPS